VRELYRITPTWKGLLEVTKPKVTILNILVSVIAFIMAPSQTNWLSLLVFCLAAYLVVGGCGALNCYLDRDIDAVMDRTSHRAIPRKILSPSNVLSFGLALMSIGLTMTYLIFGLETLLMVSLGSFFYLFVYTIWLKRRSKWNVALGAVSGGLAALAGWTATGSPLSATPVLLGLLDFLWTPGHLWSLAMRRVREYTNAKIPMMPVVSGLRQTSWYVFTFNLATVAFSFSFVMLGITGLLYIIMATIAGFLLLRYSTLLLKEPSENRGGEQYFASMLYLAIILLALLFDRLLYLPITH
jgi:protoheme IX farnesyltransferase